MNEPKALVTGVNDRDGTGHWGAQERPSSLSEQGQKREVLLVDLSGNPLLVKEPRPVGFRKP